MKYLKIILLTVAVILTARCTEEKEKLYPIVSRPDWKVMEEDFVDTPPAWTVPESGQLTAPQWEVNMKGSATSPEWVAPDMTVYPTSMTAVVRLTPVLEHFANPADRVAAFIDNECRGVASVVEMNGVKLFFIQIKAPDSENGKVEFRYYSGGHNRIYTSVADAVTYEINGIYGTAEAPAYPDFEQSGPYPYVAEAIVGIDKSKLPFTTRPNDELMAFVGGECRGITRVMAADNAVYAVDLLGTTAGEKVFFKYYSAEKGVVFVSEQTTVIEADSAKIASVAQPLALTFVPEGSMTAYFTTDDALLPYSSPEDMVAAFAGNTCMGIGELVAENSGKRVYKLVIRGTNLNTGSVDVKYYNRHSNYVFTAQGAVTFKDGDVLGDPLNPIAIPLNYKNKHPLTMDAHLVIMGHTLPKYAEETDLLGAFVGEECRGLATMIKKEDGSFSYKMRINGDLSNNEQFRLKYYSSKNSYLYVSDETFSFSDGTHLGTEDKPAIIKLSVVE